MSNADRQPPLTIRMHERDNVAIVANDGGLPAGTAFPSGLTLREHVPQGHKVALVDLAADSAVLRYNVAIGYAMRDIPAGSWVHERLLRMPEARELDNLPIATVKPGPLSPLDGYTFEGYRNADGSVGTRNILAITTTVQCVAGVVDFAVKRIKEELLPRFPNVDDVVGLEHTYGCGVAIDAPDATVPASELVVGVQCGGSDAFSGVTANPAVGFCTDLLVRAGATVMFSEVTEVRDGIDQLTSRAINAEVADAMIRQMAWYDAYLQKGRVDRSANTTPGNKKGW